MPCSLEKNSLIVVRRGRRTTPPGEGSLGPFMDAAISQRDITSCHRGGLGEEIPFLHKQENSNAWVQMNGVAHHRGRTEPGPGLDPASLPVYRVVGQQATKDADGITWAGSWPGAPISGCGSSGGLAAEAPSVGV